MAKKELPSITVGLLRQALSEYPDSFTVDFGGLSFYRVKQRGQTHLQVEFDQLVSLDDKGRVVVHDPG